MARGGVCIFIVLDHLGELLKLFRFSEFLTDHMRSMTTFQDFLNRSPKPTNPLIAQVYKQYVHLENP